MKLYELSAKQNQSSEVAKSLGFLKPDLQTYTMNVFKKKRTAATHLMVFMVSSERRKEKPYALPVWYLPFSSETDATVRTWTNSLKESLVASGLNVIGDYYSSVYNLCYSLSLSTPW